MEIFIAEQCKSLAESCIMGLIFGAGYDIISILYVLWGIRSYKRDTCGSGRAAFWLFLAGDTLYMLAAAIGASLFLYYANHGQFRLFLALGCTAGFLLYRCTVGRLVMYLSEAIVSFLKKMVFHTVIRPVRFVYGILVRCIKTVFRFTAGTLCGILSAAAAYFRMKRCIKRFPAVVRL